MIGPKSRHQDTRVRGEWGSWGWQRISRTKVLAAQPHLFLSLFLFPSPMLHPQHSKRFSQIPYWESPTLCHSLLGKPNTAQKLWFSSYFCLNKCTRMLCSCQTVFKAAKMIIFSLSFSVSLLTFLNTSFFVHICRSTRQSICVRRWLLKKATKRHFKISDLSFPHIWTRM